MQNYLQQAYMYLSFLSKIIAVILWDLKKKKNQIHNIFLYNERRMYKLYLDSKSIINYVHCSYISNAKIIIISMKNYVCFLMIITLAINSSYE